jgi:hypothetical protein
MHDGAAGIRVDVLSRRLVTAGHVAAGRRSTGARCAAAGANRMYDGAARARMDVFGRRLVADGSDSAGG